MNKSNVDTCARSVCEIGHASGHWYGWTVEMFSAAIYHNILYVEVIEMTLLEWIPPPYKYSHHCMFGWVMWWFVSIWESENRWVLSRWPRICRTMKLVMQIFYQCPRSGRGSHSHSAKLHAVAIDSNISGVCPSVFFVLIEWIFQHEMCDSQVVWCFQ